MESPINHIIYDVSRHKCPPLWSTSPWLAPSEKPLTRLDEWQGMDQKKVGAYGGSKA